MLLMQSHDQTAKLIDPSLLDVARAPPQEQQTTLKREY
jgi:hypothetical protein